MTYISARQKGRAVIYTDDNGKEIKFSSGDISWRTNNPGNLWPGDVSKRNHQIGKFDSFVIFPNYEIGHAALLDSLQTTHWNKNLSQMINIFAPKNDHNDPVRYLRFLQKHTGVKDNRKIRAFTPEQFESLWRAIEKMEGGKPGKIEEIKQISRVGKDKKGTIVNYYIEGMGWVSKKEGIGLAERGNIDAVVAISRSGNSYLRTRPDVFVENNLENIGS